MKVVYVPNNNPNIKEYALCDLKDITPGKIYHVIEKFTFDGFSAYFIMDDLGITKYLDEIICGVVLIPLEKYRESKLNELGI
jgi:hypothetical protein